ncbi:hypothetical protein CP10743SC13_1901, partial [Chlamydia psittaci 10_743_SC13]
MKWGICKDKTHDIHIKLGVSEEKIHDFFLNKD